MKVSLLQEGSLDTRMFVEKEAEDPDAFLNTVLMCQFCFKYVLIYWPCFAGRHWCSCRRSTAVSSIKFAFIIKGTGKLFAGLLIFEMALHLLPPRGSLSQCWFYALQLYIYIFFFFPMVWICGI